MHSAGIHLEPEGREILLQAATNLEGIASAAEEPAETLVEVQATRAQMHNKFEEAEDADSAHPSLWRIDPREELERAFDLSRDLTAERAATSVRAAVSKAGEAVASLAVAPSVDAAVRAYSDAVGQALIRRIHLQQMVD